MDFLELFDAVVRDSKLVLDGYTKPTSMDDKLADLGLDSLDFVMVFMLLGDMHGIPEDIADNPPELTTIQEAKDFVDQHKVRDFDTVAAAMEAVK